MSSDSLIHTLTEYLLCARPLLDRARDTAVTRTAQDLPSRGSQSSGRDGAVFRQRYPGVSRAGTWELAQRRCLMDIQEGFLEEATLAKTWRLRKGEMGEANGK